MKKLLELSSRTVSKILQRMNIGCFVCGWNEATCDIHHIVPRSKQGSNENSNLTVLCPNCHRIAHARKIKSFPSIEERIGDSWKQFYFDDRTSNPKVKALISTGMKKAHSEGRALTFGKKLESTEKYQLRVIELYQTFISGDYSSVRDFHRKNNLDVSVMTLLRYWKKYIPEYTSNSKEGKSYKVSNK